jgi:hypothetical protein
MWGHLGSITTPRVKILLLLQALGGAGTWLSMKSYGFGNYFWANKSTTLFYNVFLGFKHFASLKVNLQICGPT